MTVASLYEQQVKHLHHYDVLYVSKLKPEASPKPDGLLWVSSNVNYTQLVVNEPKHAKLHDGPLNVQLSKTLTPDPV